MDKAITDLKYIMTLVSSVSQTLIHNDCNPRNMCLRLPCASSVKTDNNSIKEITLQVSNGQMIPYPDFRMMCLYDWELSTIGVPQHDVAEFLSFVLQPSTPLSTWLELLDFYRLHLQFFSGVEYPLDK